MADANPHALSPAGTDDDPIAEDPFFQLPDDSNWNACIGRQGNEENYIDGYIEGARELAGSVIEKKMYSKRDTLVLPILYNARHAVELVQKFAISRLFAVSVLKHSAPKNHDILSHWRLLSDANLGDEELRGCITALDPFVKSLARVDDDGQALRYHLNREEETSLATYSLANLEIIRDGLAALSKQILGLKHRTLDYIDERRTGSYTSRLSRRDLLCIAKTMPPLIHWKDDIFDERKQIIQTRFGLSNTEFSKALNVIKINREMKALVGGETSLNFLPDDLLVWVIQQWRRQHPHGESDDDSAIVKMDKRTLEAVIKYARMTGEVVTALEKRLTNEQIAELQTLFYLGRDGWFPEFYDEEVETTIEQHVIENDPHRQIRHLIEKTNFLEEITLALPRLGRPSLATRISAL
jgi:hypothetical protein